VRFLDLSLPLYWLPRYDWVVILEVLEHIPASYEPVALDNVARTAGVGVVLSWAVLGQGGYAHVNNRSPQHVSREMRFRNFTEDDNRTRTLRAAATVSWLRKNVRVFLR